jgi:hypothetical protein
MASRSTYLAPGKRRRVSWQVTVSAVFWLSLDAASLILAVQATSEPTRRSPRIQTAAEKNSKLNTKLDQEVCLRLIFIFGDLT